MTDITKRRENEMTHLEFLKGWRDTFTDHDSKEYEALHYLIDLAQKVKDCGGMPDIAKILEGKSLFGGKAKEEVAQEITDLCTIAYIKLEAKIKDCEGFPKKREFGNDASWNTAVPIWNEAVEGCRIAYVKREKELVGMLENYNKRLVDLAKEKDKEIKSLQETQQELGLSEEEELASMHKITRLEARIKELEEEAKLGNIIIYDLQAKITELEARIRFLQNDVTHWMNKLAQLKETLSQEIMKYTVELESKDKEIEELTNVAKSASQISENQMYQLSLLQEKGFDWDYLSCAKCGRQERVKIDKLFNKELPTDWVKNNNPEIHNCYCPNCQEHNSIHRREDEDIL